MVFVGTDDHDCGIHPQPIESLPVVFGFKPMLRRKNLEEEDVVHELGEMRHVLLHVSFPMQDYTL